AAGDEARAAGGEGPLTRQGGRQDLRRKRFPVGSAVCSDNQLKQPFYGVAKGDAVLLVPEGHGIKKSRRVVTLELRRPRLAAVNRLVNAGGVAGAGAEQIGSGLPKRFDIAEVELCRAGHGSDRPGFAAVSGSRVSTLGAADPCDAGAHNAKAAQIAFGTVGLCLPLGESDGTAEAKKDRGEKEACHAQARALTVTPQPLAHSRP